ncbi:hypothetical protein RB653_005530 [Dictyostelium firmibasis]|uniref:Uncharacterized protein n=1 Tax=Dictyostelium firmibasis TaxID=79012 RepID=A0AAN7Z4E1_9MYCE
MRLLAALLLIIYAAQNGVYARNHIVSLAKGENFQLSIDQGDSVNFHVRDGLNHELTMQGESQSFANISPKQTKKQEFNEAGEFIVTDSSNNKISKIIVNKKQVESGKWFEKDAKEHANKMAANKEMEQHEDLQKNNDAQNTENAKPSSANKNPNANKAKPSSDTNDAKPSSNVNDAKPSADTNDAKPSSNTKETANKAKPKTDETNTKAGNPKQDAKPKTNTDDTANDVDDEEKTEDKAKPKADEAAAGNTSSTLVVNVMLLAASAVLALAL